jgi:hypothetical protein
MSAVGDARKRQAEAGREPDLLAALRALADEWEQAYNRWRNVYDGPRVSIFHVHATRLRALIAAHQPAEPERTCECGRRPDPGVCTCAKYGGQNHCACAPHTPAHQSERTDMAEARSRELPSCGVPGCRFLPAHTHPAQPSEPEREGER